MNREEVIKSIERKGSKGFPLFFMNRDFELADFRGTGVIGNDASIWGVNFHSLDNTMGQVGKAPVGSYKDLEKYKRPDPYEAGRFAHMEDFLRANEGVATVAGTGIMGFNWCCFVRGMEDFMMDLYTDKPFALEITDMVFEYMYGIIDQACDYDIDFIRIDDDAGTQENLMISPAIWREIFKPRYKKIIDLIHKKGKKLWLHSCGMVDAIITDYIEIGLDVIELLQPDIFGVEYLGRNYGGKITFCCSVDHQRRAVQGTKEEIFEYVKRLYDNLNCFEGGLIGCLEFYDSLGMTEDNYNYIKEAFFKYARQNSQ